MSALEANAAEFPCIKNLIKCAKDNHLQFLLAKESGVDSDTVKFARANAEFQFIHAFSKALTYSGSPFVFTIVAELEKLGYLSYLSVKFNARSSA